MIKGATGPGPWASPRSSRPACDLVHRFADEEKKPRIATPPTIPSLVPMRSKRSPTVYARLVHSGPNARKSLEDGPSRAIINRVAHNHENTSNRPFAALLLTLSIVWW